MWQIEYAGTSQRSDCLTGRGFYSTIHPRKICSATSFDVAKARRAMTTVSSLDGILCLIQVVLLPFGVLEK